MAENKVPQIDGIELRRDAEERLGEIPEADLLKEKDPLRLLHELQVHQIELEMQNSELRKTRDELETTLDMCTELYDFAPVGYATLDRDGTILRVNHACSRLLGVEHSGLIGRRLEQFVAVAARPAFADFHEKVYTSHAKESFNVEFLKEGYPALFIKIEAVAASGEESRIALIDITEQKEAEEQIKKLNKVLSARTAELENANEALTAFNYTVAHDLKQPLNNIYTSSQVIEMLCGDKLDEESKEYLQIVKTSAINLSNLITTLLTFSHSDHTEPERKNVDLSTMAMVIGASLRLNEPGRRVTFKIDEGLTANGDPDLMQVVLDNLFGNAWKYTASLKQASIEFGAREMDGILTYFIRDNGPGFDMQEAEGLFLPFKRLSGSDCTGHGIGLATVERIIKRHGGKIWAIAEPGKGATFYFTVPDKETS